MEGQGPAAAWAPGQLRLASLHWPQPLVQTDRKALPLAPSTEVLIPSRAVASSLAAEACSTSWSPFSVCYLISLMLLE